MQMNSVSAQYDGGIYIVTTSGTTSNFGRLENIYIANATTGINISGNATGGYSTEMELDNIQIADCVTCINLDYAQSISIREPTLADSDYGLTIRGSDQINVMHGDFERQTTAHINFADSTVLASAASARIKLDQCIFGENTSSSFVSVLYTGPTYNIGNILLDQCSFWVQAQQYFSNNAHFSYVEFRQPAFGNTGLNFLTLTNVPHRYNGKGYQQSGSWTTVSNGDWKSHYLKATPTSVVICSDDSNTVWVSGKNATKFQIGVSAGTPDIYYYAEYQP